VLTRQRVRVECASLVTEKFFNKVEKVINVRAYLSKVAKEQ
jgi:hypothetical protein